jgi:hypothetical protein
MSISETQVIEQDKKTGRFLPGNSGFGGRPKGARNKLGEAFISDMYADWRENGVAVIEAVRKEKPDVYLRVVAGILPRELNVSVAELDELNDDELDRRIASLVRALDIKVGEDPLGGNASGKEDAAGPQQTIELQALPETS